MIGWQTGDLISKNIHGISASLGAGLVWLGVDPYKLYAPDVMPDRYKVNAEKTVDDLKEKYSWEKKTGGKGGEGTDIYDAEGGFGQANKDFDEIVSPGSSKAIPGGRVGKTSDGKTINVRGHSTQDNRPTLEIYNPRTQHKETKFRY